MVKLHPIICTFSKILQFPHKPVKKLEQNQIAVSKCTRAPQSKKAATQSRSKVYKKEVSLNSCTPQLRLTS